MRIPPGCTRYPNRSRRSGVGGYRFIADHGIGVCFRDGAVYEYTAEITGAEHVAALRTRAEQGRWLATYLNQHDLAFRRVADAE